MRLSFFRKNKINGLTAFLGFKAVRPVLNETGQEKFGVIELASDYTSDVFPIPPNRLSRRLRRKDRIVERVFSVALRLSGPELNRWLSDNKSDQDFFTSLCEALPYDSPAQFILQRRHGQLGAHYTFWREQVARRMSDEEVAGGFLQDYLDSFVYPVEDNGLADVWCALLISGRSEEELTEKLAILMGTLPCEASPCSSAELSLRLLDYYAPELLQIEREAGEPDTDVLYPAWFRDVPFQVKPDRILNDQWRAYWTLAAPPLKYEAGWTRRLLENEMLVNSEFDITVHLAPAEPGSNMREVLERRLIAIGEHIEDALDSGRETEAAELQEQQIKIENRLVALINQTERYFEVGINLALRAYPDSFEQECEIFEEELHQCGLAAYRTRTIEQTQSAMLDCAPLNLSRFDRPLLLPVVEAGRLVHLGVVGQQAQYNQPLVGLSPAGEAVYLNPAVKRGQSAFFLLGEIGKPSTHDAACLVRYMSAMRWLRSGAVFGFDRKGNWVRLLQQVGGRYVALGPNEPEFNFNPLEISADTLNQLSNIENWINQMQAFVSDLLKLDDGLKEDLSAVLVEAAITQARRNEGLSAASLWIHAETSGYALLAEQLKELCQNGKFGWLCAAPTRLPTPASRNELLFMGLSPELRNALSEEMQQYYWARLFVRFASQIGTKSASRPYLLLVDEAHEFLADNVASRTLGWLGYNSGQLGFAMWLLAPRADEWLNSYAGRDLIEKAQTHVFFNQTGPGLSGLARRLNLSQRFVRAVRDAIPGAALVRQINRDGEVNLFGFEPLPGDYILRLGSAPAQIRGEVSVPPPPPPQKTKPIEVPLFAAEEIWNEESKPPESTVVIEEADWQPQAETSGDSDSKSSSYASA